jgi:protoporphyrinogen/coproporphyrinogen III oxidase
VYPLLAAYYGALPESTSAGVYHALARIGIDVTVYAAAGGFGALADAWLASIESAGCRYVTATEVTRVESESEDVRLQTAAGEVRHDAAIVAVPAGRAAQLVTGSELGVWLSRVRVEPTLTVAYRMDRAFPGDYFGLSFPRESETGRSVVALCIQSRKLAGLVPGGGDALVALPAPHATAALLQLDDDAAAAAVLAAVEPSVPGISKHVSSAHVYRYDDGYTIFPPGYLRHLTRFETAWLPPRVELAGDYLLAPSVEGAVRSGERAAERVLAALGSAARGG